MTREVRSNFVYDTNDDGTETECIEVSFSMDKSEFDDIRTGLKSEMKELLDWIYDSLPA